MDSQALKKAQFLKWRKSSLSWFSLREFFWYFGASWAIVVILNPATVVNRLASNIKVFYKMQNKEKNSENWIKYIFLMKDINVLKGPCFQNNLDLFILENKSSSQYSPWILCFNYSVNFAGVMVCWNRYSHKFYVKRCHIRPYWLEI